MRTAKLPGSEVAFAEAKARRGIDQKKRSIGKVYLGIGLAAEDGPEGPAATK